MIDIREENYDSKTRVLESLIEIYGVKPENCNQCIMELSLIHISEPTRRS